MLHPGVEETLRRLGVDHEVMACAPDLADTAAFCQAYGVDPADSANTILVAAKRPVGPVAAALVLATHRLDVNRAVRDAMGVSKVSFADAETTVRLTGMVLGGVTPFSLPAEIPLLIDGAVMERERIVLGGGNRTSKMWIDPAELHKLEAAVVVAGLAYPVP